MKIVLALIGLAAILFIAVRWLRLVWFRASTLRIITQEFSYPASVPGFQGPIFNGITKETRNHGGNPYDAAITFMLVQLNSLSEPLDSKSLDFAQEKLGLIHHVARIWHLKGKILFAPSLNLSNGMSNIAPNNSFKPTPLRGAA